MEKLNQESPKPIKVCHSDMKSQVRYSVEDTGQHRMVFGHIISATTLFRSQ